MLRATLSIAAKDLRQRFRDRSALVLAFVAPLLIATLLNFATGGVQEFHVSLAVADRDGGPIAQQLVTTLRSEDLAEIVTVVDAADAPAARARLDAGDADAAIVIPEGFSAAVASDGPASLEVLTTVDAELGGEVARSIASSFTAQLSGVRLAVAAALAAGASHQDVDAVIAAAVAADPPEVVVQRPSGTRPMKGIAYFGPAMGIFFVLFAVGFTARSFFIERTQGTLDRMVAAPILPAAVLAGKALSVFVYALSSLLVVTLVAGVLFDASWGSPLGVVVLCVAMSTAVVALAALVMSIARTERQAETIASAIGFTMSLLGGNFAFLGNAPSLMRRLAAFTPNGQALRGFTDLGTGAPVGDAVVQPVLVMLAFALAVGGLAVVTGRRAVIR